MSAMTGLDWGIVVAYLVLSVVIGVLSSRSASESTESFFVAGRSLPWWVAGTSMVATTFAADTPLWVTGTVAKYGIAGNWFWWGFAMAHVLAAVYLAKLWRRAEVMTDAQVIEERYSGRPAAALRAFKAFFFAVVINCITIGWVVLAMRKIMGVFVDWSVILPQGWFAALVSVWPHGLSIDPSTALSVFVAMALAVGYSVMGGLRGVVLTDLVQFVLAMTGAIAVAVFAVHKVGGLDQLVIRLQQVTGDAKDVLAYAPAADSTWMPLQLFGLYLLVLWWAQKYSDAGGYIMQRMAACKDDRHAAGATLWFTALHYVGRTWPWVLAALAALVLYPVAKFPHLDREATYPMLMRDVLPPGLLGVAVASLAAAFMSTIDTQVNWGASYLVKDIYQRFLNRHATEQHYVKASRWAVAIIAVVAAVIALHMTSIDAAWKFFMALGSGLGLVSLARWVWWRVNAWSELSALFSTCAVTTVLLFFPHVSYPVQVLSTMGISTVVWVAVTFLTRPTDPARLEAFYRRVRPLGFWGPVRARCPEVPPKERPASVLTAWASGIAFVYLLLFGTGSLLIGRRGVGAVMVAAGALFGWLTYQLILGRRQAAPAEVEPAG